MKAHGEMAHKGLTNYVYDDDNSIKLPSGDLTKSETVFAAKSSETKEDLATPKIIASQKQDHWILDKKNKQLIRAHITPRKALLIQMEPKSVQSCAGYWNCLTVHAKGFACDLVTLRCVLDGHVEVPHLTDAEEDRYSSLFKDVDVGTAWRSCVISKTQGPIYPDGLSVCKSELGLGRDVLIG